MSKGKKILLGGFGVLGLCVAIVCGIAATKPDQIHVERSLVIGASPEHVFTFAHDLKKFVTWMPWKDLDPSQTMEFSDPAVGVGAWYTWKGNDDVGSGRMEIISAAPNKVVHTLEFIEPFTSFAESSFAIEPAGAGSVEVTWSYDQEADFSSKLMMVFMDFDKMLGADFEKGLANLKVLAESPAS